MACFASVSALGTALVLAAAGDEVVTIGTEVPFPPYVMQTADGGLEGFEYDVMQDICRREDWTCDWQLASFEELIPGLLDGRFDVVLGGMAITEERRRRVDFTLSYHDADDQEWFVGLTGAPPPAQARISVQAGTVHESYLRGAGLDYQAFPSETGALRAVIDGAADLALGPFENRDDLAPVLADAGLEPLYDVHISDDGTAMAVCKGNTELLDRLNAALAAMGDDGTLGFLETRWF